MAKDHFMKNYFLKKENLSLNLRFIQKKNGKRSFNGNGQIIQEVLG